MYYIYISHVYVDVRKHAHYRSACAHCYAKIDSEGYVYRFLYPLSGIRGCTYLGR